MIIRIENFNSPHLLQGVGNSNSGDTLPLSLLTATIFASVAAGVMMGWRGGLVISFIGGITLIGVIYFKKRLGGVTGDVLGAVNEVNEVMVLLVILIMSQFRGTVKIYGCMA